MESTRAAFGWIALVAIALTSALPARADRDDGTTASQARQVRLEGTSVRSSTNVPRTPRFTLVSSAAQPRRVRILGLSSLGPGRETRAHVVTGATSFVLAPRERREIEPEYEGQPLMAQSSGLGWYRFRLRIAVEGARIEAIALTAYMCRIPIRLDRASN